MKIDLVNVGKKYDNHHWILRDLNLTFVSGQRYAISGHNGSGKTTLLKMISGYLTPSLGHLRYTLNDQEIPRYAISTYVNVALPNEGLIDELSFMEMVRFHFDFNDYLTGWSEKRLLDTIQLSTHRNKRLLDFSSGMLQRLKLALCCISSGDIVLLDEPTSFLDDQSTQWYYDLLAQTNAPTRLWITASNDPKDFWACSMNYQL